MGKEILWERKVHKSWASRSPNGRRRLCNVQRKWSHKWR